MLSALWLFAVLGVVVLIVFPVHHILAGNLVVWNVFELNILPTAKPTKSLARRDERKGQNTRKLCNFCVCVLQWGFVRLMHDNWKVIYHPPQNVVSSDVVTILQSGRHIKIVIFWGLNVVDHYISILMNCSAILANSCNRSINRIKWKWKMIISPTYQNFHDGRTTLNTPR